MDVLFEVKDGVAHITLNRPNMGNALTRTMIERLFEILTEIEQNEDIYCSVLSGAGKFWCSGGDLSSNASSNNNHVFAETTENHFLKLKKAVKKPMIARVQGAHMRTRTAATH
jgi:enoyl-CoA hydratase/carnithine racemase